MREELHRVLPAERRRALREQRVVRLQLLAEHFRAKGRGDPELVWTLLSALRMAHFHKQLTWRSSNTTVPTDQRSALRSYLLPFAIASMQECHDHTAAHSECLEFWAMNHAND